MSSLWHLLRDWSFCRLILSCMDTVCCCTTQCCTYNTLLHQFVWQFMGPFRQLATRFVLGGPGSIPGEGKIFSASTYRSCATPSLLGKRYHFTFPGVKRPELGVNYPPIAEIKERVELQVPSSVNFPFTSILSVNEDSTHLGSLTFIFIRN
jgi:hypothetical protein